jgi:hypothetical protein
MTSLEQFIERATHHILKCRSTETALKKARFLGELLWKNSTGCHHLNDLEQTLLAKLRTQLESELSDSISIAKPIRYLHVLSKAYDTGGHTRVVERLISTKALQESAVFITETCQEKSLTKLNKASQGCQVLANTLKGEQKLLALFKVFSQAKTLILHIHPCDIESVMAAGLAQHLAGTQVLLYNHADHVFTYGYSIADQVLELSHFGWGMREKRGIKGKASFAGIPLNINNAISTSEHHAHSGYIASAGSAYKFKPGMNYSFPAFASSLLNKTKIKLAVIGPRAKRDWWWWRVKSEHSKQLEIIPKMAHQAYLNFLNKADAYIDSFPLTGGTSFSEILCLGIPCFGVLTGAHGYSPADLIKSPNLAQMETDLLNFLNGGKYAGQQHPNLVELVLNCHQSEQVAMRIAQVSQNSSIEISPPWDNPYSVDCSFYEKIWKQGKMFALPVHSWPQPILFTYFFRYWLVRNAESNMGLK